MSSTTYITERVAPLVAILERLRLALGKLVLSAYRWFAILVLYGVLAMVGAYIVTMGFYAFSTSWVAPFMVAPTNDKILDLTAKLVASQQTLNNLIVDRDRLQGSLDDMRTSKADLDKLAAEFHSAIVLQSHGNHVDAPELQSLHAQKLDDNIQTEKGLTDVQQVEARIDNDLNAGLITKGDAAVAKVQLRQSRNAYTNGRIEEVLLRDNVRSKAPTYTSRVDALAKEAELKNSIIQLAMQISSGEQQLYSDKTQIEKLKEAVATAQNSPYFLATKGNVRFAFVPYDNQKGVSEGADVFGCYLNMVFCRRVGKIDKIFSEEEKATHPVFKNDIRGFLVQLELSDPEAAKGKVLFVGGKPMFF
jgi:hypothetical protein